MRWLGLQWDEEPCFQSARLDVYEAFVERLLSAGKAYYCRCTPEEVAQRRELARAQGRKPRYDGKCRDLGLGPSPGSVVRLRSPQKGRIAFEDLVKGPLAVDIEELDDLVLRRADGSPTYHLAVVADDITMGVTHVIRGDDHVNNTPRQILIYQALAEPLPYYAHVPMILGPDKARLSKRHGAMSVLAYRDMGYLPEALLNALVRLGWSFGDEERFTREEMIAKFSLEAVGTSPGIFDQERLLDLNAYYIRSALSASLADLLVPFLQELNCGSLDRKKVVQAVDTLKPRSQTLAQMAQNGCFYFQEEIRFERKGDDKFLTSSALELMVDIKKRLADWQDFSQSGLERVFGSFLEEKQIKLGKIAQPLRVALTGKTASPGLFEVMEVLGKEKTLDRLKRAISHIEAKLKTLRRHDSQ
jgi:glutamyl-tRNA synthetase